MAYVYILCSRKNGTLYVGVTTDLIKRVYQHKNSVIESFTSKYSVHRLVYFEESLTIIEAIRREKQLKKWQRKWKIELIEDHNPEWKDLHNDLL